MSRLSTARPLAALALLLLAGCAADDRSIGTMPDAMQSAADQAVAGGRPDEAAQYYAMALRQNPADRDLRLRTAKALRAAGRPGDALAVLEPLSNEASAPVAALTEAARAALEADRPQTALIFAQRAVERQPSDPAAQTALGVALNALDRHAEADRAYQAALAAGAGDVAPILNNLGLSQAQQGRIEEALATLRRAEMIDPKNTVTKDNLKLVQAIAVSGHTPGLKPPAVTVPLIAPPAALMQPVQAMPAKAPAATAHPLPAPQPLTPPSAPAKAPLAHASPVHSSPVHAPEAKPLAPHPEPAKPAAPLAHDRVSVAALAALKSAPPAESHAAIKAEPIAPAAMTGGRAVAFRYGHEGNRDRLVLDRADAIGASVQSAGGGLMLSLPAGSTVNLATVDKELARSVSSTRLSDDGATLSMALKPGVKARTYRLGDRLVIDFRR